MGLGDWIMATSQVKDAHASNEKPVHVVGLGGRPMWSEVFDNNPKILRKPEAGCNVLLNGPNARPYIAAKYERRWVWKKWDIKPGELFLTDIERRFAKPYEGCVLIEPHTKLDQGNKSWYWDRWQQVVRALPQLRFVQAGPFNTRLLDEVEGVTTRFRQAAAILEVASCFVGAEGALHHAAAALGCKSVVLWSEFISPEITGYSTQRNLRHASEACGARVPCVGCKLSMEMITVEEVVEAIKETLR